MAQLTQLKVKLVNVQLASGVMKGITVNKAFNATTTKIVVNHAPVDLFRYINRSILLILIKNVTTFIVNPGRIKIRH